MPVPATDRLLVGMRSAITNQLKVCGFSVCKEMVTHDGTVREVECCANCDGGLAVAVWEDQAFQTTSPPILLPPDPGSGSYVVCHQLAFTVAACWPQPDPIPLTGDPREDTAIEMAKVRDCIWTWLDRCRHKVEQLTPDGMDVWNLGDRSRSGIADGNEIECVAWEWTIVVW